MYVMITEMDKKEFIQLRKKLLENEFGMLNDPQRQAVFHINGPLLVLAGAGSGKTSVLVNRIAYMIKYGNAYHSDYIPKNVTEDDLKAMRELAESGGPLPERISELLKERPVHPASILAITFTNKAAREMKQRLAAIVGEAAEYAWVSTFHAACVRILRRDIERLGFGRNFVIYDTADQQALIKDCVRELNLNDKNFPAREVLSHISKVKDELIEPQRYFNMYGSDFRLGKIARIYELYQKKLKSNNALDFDDIIMMTIKLLLDYPDILEIYQRKFRYILVDEYQDTNKAQYTLVSLLAGYYRNLCAVGDDDQSIYGWRGADITNILDFEKEFKDSTVIKLEQNYRSTKNILNAANNVIKNNAGRKSKKLWTENEQGDLIQVFEADDERGEADFIAGEIERLMEAEGRSYKDFAVLYRINAQSRALEEGLMKAGIPYRIFGGLRFYDRKEIKDIIAYLRLIQNPDDDISLKRIINVPKRGIGNATLDTAEEIAADRNISIFSVISGADDIPELKRAASKLKSFVSMINEFRAKAEEVSVSELIETVIEQSGILQELKEENTPEAQSRIENIKELISGAIEFEANYDDFAAQQLAQGDDFEPGSMLESYLANISLVSDIDNLEEDKDYVVLMTMHSAKGLEFPVVIIAGFEDGVFPGLQAMVSEKELEEERRLCYVGITRAKEKLILTYCHCRVLFGNTTYNKCSMFLDEIPPELLELKSGRAYMQRSYQYTQDGSAYSRGLYQDEPGAGFGTWERYGAGRADGKQNRYGERTQYGAGTWFGTGTISGGTQTGGQLRPFGGRDMTGVTQKAQPGALEFKEGDNVVHKKFGVGKILSVTEDGGDKILEIEFKNHGMKRLVAAYANLVKL